MIITPLGHTEFLIDIENSSGRNVRIMVDGWYSDYAIGDLMERTVKVQFDHEKLKTVDALYISHAHCDHFDPYTLLEMYAHANPLLLLPETLIYLKPLLEEYVPTIQIQILRNKEVFRLHDIEIVATAFAQEYVTNEDDVLTLSVASEREVLFAEIDTAPSETPETYKYLYRLFTKRNYETVCYVASRNELEGNLKILDFNTEKEREKFRGEFLHKRKEEIEWDYAKWEYEDYADVSNYMALPGFVRGFIGQGICYPLSMNQSLSGLGCFTLDEVVDRETNYAREYGYEFSQKVLTPGRQYRIEEGKIENGRKECPIGTLETINIKTPLSTTETRKYSDGPLLKDERDFEVIASKVLEILNHKFLPYWFGSGVANLRDAILRNPDRTYRILLTGNSPVSVIPAQAGIQPQRAVFSFSFAQNEFTRTEYVE